MHGLRSPSRRKAVSASCTRTWRRRATRPRSRRSIASKEAPSMSVRQVLALTHQYRISGLPVVDGRKVVGIVTNRDLRFETNLDQPVSQIMTPAEKLVTVPEGTDLDTA